MMQRIKTRCSVLLAALLAACGGGDPEPAPVPSGQRAQAMAQSPGDGLGGGSAGQSCAPQARSDVVTPGQPASWVRTPLCSGQTVHQISFQSPAVPYEYSSYGISYFLRYSYEHSISGQAWARCMGTTVRFRVERLQWLNGALAWVKVQSGELLLVPVADGSGQIVCNDQRTQRRGPMPGGYAGLERVVVEVEVPDGPIGKVTTSAAVIDL